MPKLPNYETIADIEHLINNLSESIGILNYIGKHSDTIQQARFEQFAQSLTKTTTSLTLIKNELRDLNIQES